MAATKKTSQGTLVYYRPLGSTDASAWKIIHSITDHGTTAERGAIDTTTHSTLGTAKEFIPEALHDPGEYTATGFYEPNITSPASAGNLITNGAHHELMASVGLDSAIYDVHLVYPKAGANATSHSTTPPTDRTYQTFSAFLTNYSQGSPIEGRPTIEFTFKRTGAITINSVV